MQQKQPKFSGILVVAVLMVLVLFFISLSPLLAETGNKDTTYSEIYYYFENQQVTSFRLNLGTGSLELWLKEGNIPLPESNAAASLPNGGLLSLNSSDNDALPDNGGTVYMTYKLPYGGDFNTGKISDFVDEYNAANPDAPMVFDYVAAKTSVPWLEIIFYVAMIGSIGMLFMSMYRGGAGGGHGAGAEDGLTAHSDGQRHNRRLQHLHIQHRLGSVDGSPFLPDPEAVRQ